MMTAFTQPDFLKNSSAISYGFFGRGGGVSDGIYSSLNCGQGSNDNPGHVEENRARVAAEIGAPREGLISVYQIHSDLCLYVDTPWRAEDRPQADAMVTDKAEIALAVLTADCTPVLFRGVGDDGAPVIGAAHAGWRGAFGGVLESTVVMMGDCGAKMDSIEACIGPSIRQASYEVDAGFYQNFLDMGEHNARFFVESQNDGHHMFDLSGYCVMRLKDAGVKKIYDLAMDTYALEEEFFSYRRTTHRGEGDYGRQISAIMIKP